MRRALGHRRVGSYLDHGVGADRRGAPHLPARAIGPLQFRAIVLPEKHIVAVDIEIVTGLCDLNFAANLVAVHVRIAEHQGCLLRRHSGAQVILGVRLLLAGALAAIGLFLASVRGEAIQLVRCGARHRRVGGRRHAAQRVVKFLLHLHPHVHVANLCLFVSDQPRPLPRPLLPQGNAELPYRGRIPTRDVTGDVVKQAQRKEVLVLVVGVLAEA
mmetsp:Transcript_85351/g.261006  ORF Transcript_85351/g.261006 Transcript_85351/m.261006 type:complete len:215 (-) Transcript_85351:505-1149(-)